MEDTTNSVYLALHITHYFERRWTKYYYSRYRVCPQVLLSLELKTGKA